MCPVEHHRHTGGAGDAPQIDTPGIADEAITAAKLDAFFTKFHVKKAADGGSDSNNGSSWAKAFANVQTGLDAVGALEKRGKGIVLVGSGWYEEDLTTPTNSEAPFGMLLGISPSGVSRGGACLQAVTAGRATLRILARGWKVAGFEFDALADAGCIDLDSVAGSAAYAEIVGNLICGQNQGLYGIDYMGNVPLTTIAMNDIYGFKSNAGKGAHGAAANNGTGIIQSNVAADVARFAKILENSFWDNENHIWQKGGGFKESVIRGNNWLRWGSSNYARRILEIVQAGGPADPRNNNIIEDNHGEGFSGDIICQQVIAANPRTRALFKVVGGPIEVVELGYEALGAFASGGDIKFIFTDVGATGTDLCVATTVATALAGDTGMCTGDVSDALLIFTNGVIDDLMATEPRGPRLAKDGTISVNNTGGSATGLCRFFIRYRKIGQAGFVNQA